ncbi:MAG: phosphatidylglycerophosphatase [Candidatus Electronema aureum]|uniref:Phosphatidylglycerophosphatase n=1 Tax=Candidatus Electronema aureum TaxID=2005002 RepID=A0A521G1M6_9BACT|nr:MAG: phosphatidylglycerophosphatase [Candidatus Electronema aureum]
MDKLFLFIATGAGSGYLPKAPGTWGSLVGVLLWLAGMHRLALGSYLAVLAVLFIIGTVAASAAEKIVDQGDPGIVVIDEIVGQLLTLTLAPAHPLAALAGFALFRLFDIRKPFPVGWLDQRIHGGLGIMLDDVAAGIYALLILQAGVWLCSSI